ncbi:uncharacterized protein LOC142620502 [Castanea sativa]|uniref:uncharacterized protein LOC142620502 n=1 Tax=Castanea sativa TaxID=21020 RepID=UPI003F650DF6
MIKGEISNELLARFMQIPREKNEQADRLAKVASTEYMFVPNQVLSFVQYSLTIDKVAVQVIPIGTNWTTPIISYLRNGTLTKDHNASRKLKVQSSRFMLIRDVLYKRGFSHPYLRCLVLAEVDYVVREDHEGMCGNHLEARSLVHKLIQAGYY